MLFSNQQNYKSAIADYNKTLLFDPENRSSLLNKSIAFQQNKDTVSARESFDLLVKLQPNFYNGLLARSAFRAERGDTLQALSDVNRAIQLDKYSSQGFATRGLLQYQRGHFRDALADLNEAVKIDERISGYYINRAIIKYYLNDLRGTMADYDKVIELEPHNVMALYNRGLLRSQVGDNNRAIEDYDKVLQGESDNYFAYYNRGLLRSETGNFKGAVSDLSKVIKQYPEFLPAYSSRSEAKKKIGDLKGSEKDFWMVIKLEKEADKIRQAKRKEEKLRGDLADNKEKTRKQSDKNINKFKSLLVADASETESPKYKNDTRGRVQDKNIIVDLEGLFVLTYYEKSDKFSRKSAFAGALDKFNAQTKLSHKLLNTNDEVAVTEEKIKEHFASIDELSKELVSRPNDARVYFARSLDFMLVQDFNGAIEDLTRVISLDTEYTLAYYNRAVLRYKQLKYKLSTDEEKSEQALTESFSISSLRDSKRKPVDVQLADKSNRQLEYELILRDFDAVIARQSNFIWAFYNRGNVRCLQKDYRTAITDYNEAIRLEPEFAEAYFNRGLVYLNLGENEKGIADLSKAGELGISGAYNIIKRITQ
jgi:tetratricopeptide (TPR) repeat protein